jgi:hypothetical protein
MYKIYKITDNTNNNVYFGSTKTTIEKRLKQHINSYNSYLKNNIRKCSSVEIIKNNDYIIELVENVNEDINHKDREAYYIKNFECINKVIPNRTHKEYHKMYYENNKDIFIQRSKEWQHNNKDKIYTYKKIYNENNKDKINNYKKKYLDENRDLINARRREKRIEKKLSINNI